MDVLRERLVVDRRRRCRGREGRRAVETHLAGVVVAATIHPPDATEPEPHPLRRGVHEARLVSSVVSRGAP